MAQMFPSEMDPDTKSPAERMLYPAFRDGLNQSYTVFHSVAWQGLGKDGRIRDGEADFVIAHPQRGVLVLEVKGGIIQYDGPSHRWTSISQGDHRAHSIKDPFTQAKDSKYALRDMLDMMSSDRRAAMNLGHAVAFPDVTVGGIYLGPDRPSAIILDQADLGTISTWVGRCLAYWRGELKQAESAPTKAVVEDLILALGKSWELQPRMWGEFQVEASEFIRLTRQQFLILDLLNRHRRAAISGCAGSGKTMVVVEKAVRLAGQGFRTLLTCFNKTLALDLRLKLASIPNLDISNFHDLCARLAEEAGMLPEAAEDEEYYDRLLPEALIPAAEAVGTSYQAIVVDEGQDFMDRWWIPLQFLLEDPDDGILFIFFDDNQRIYVPEGAFPIQTPPHVLTHNCRNTQAIHQVVSGFYQSDDHPSALGPPGRPVEVLTYESRDVLHTQVSETLERLVGEGIPGEEIAVLTMIGKLAGDLRQLGLTDQWPPGAGEIYCGTVHGFKGLERSVIILAGVEGWMLDNWQNIERLMYVGSSRARNHLIVILSAHAAETLGKYFKGSPG